MLTSLLYHTNQIVDVQVDNVDFLQSKIVFHGRYDPPLAYCPHCNHIKHTEKGAKVRYLRIAPMGDKAAFFQ